MTTYGRATSGIIDAENARFGAKPSLPAAPAAADAVTRRRALGEVAPSNHAGLVPRVAASSTIGAPITRPVSAVARSVVPGASLLLAPAPAAVDASRMDADASIGSVAAVAPGVTDIDALEAANPAAVPDYIGQIYSHFRAEENDINEKMRAILIDWLIEVHLKFKLMPETMYLTVNIIDRFLERKLVIRQKLQLVGVTAMLLASKYEEIYAPEVRDFVYITDKAYTREQILAMESAILNALEFRITVPTAFVFLNRCLKAAAADERTTLLATYFVERTLQEYRMLAHLPSKVAAAAVNMAVRTLRGRDAWNMTLVHYSGFSQEELRATIVDLQDVLSTGASSSLQAVRKKYQNSRFGEVANIPVISLE